MHEHVLKVVDDAYQELGKVIIDRLVNVDLGAWDEVPTFKTETKVNTKRWEIRIRVDKRQQIGKIFGYVDKGTAARGDKNVASGKEYSITPKKKGGNLSFVAPLMPKTFPSPGVAGFPRRGEPHLQVRAEVLHPGIYPRNFSKNIYDEMKQREKVGSLRSVTEAAVKRAFRDIERGSYD
jgi:hypothetical protein